MQLSGWGDLGKWKSIFERILHELQEISVLACYNPHTVGLGKAEYALLATA